MEISNNHVVPSRNTRTVTNSKGSLGLGIEKQRAQKLLAEMKRLDLLDFARRSVSNPERVIFPLHAGFNSDSLERLQKIFPDMVLERAVFPEKPRRTSNLLCALEGRLPSSLLASVPRSVDVVGNVAIVEVPAELSSYKSIIGQAVSEIHGNVRLVLAKAGPVSDQYRVRDLERLAGEGSTLTLHKENNCIFRVDVSKTFFSPRLSYERLRVARQVKPGEVVVDMFAGVGPFSITMAKTMPHVEVFSIDINPEAFRLLEENILLNKVQSQVVPLLGDAAHLVKEKLTNVADRVLMNLPSQSRNFLQTGCLCLKQKGGIMHYYSFQSERDPIEASRDELGKAVASAGRKVEDYLYARLVKSTAPREWLVVVDAKVR